MTNARNLANLLGTKTKVKDVDVDGTELILDADADTSITADTDDQIDVKIGGADDFAFKANKFEVQTGSNIDMNGTELILDADGDTSITADTDDQIDFKTGGSDRVTIDSSGNTFVSKNSASRTTVGHEFKADGFTRHTVSGDKVLEIVRTSSDGEILEFFKDTTLIGHVSSRGGADLYLGSGDTNLKFAAGTDVVVPANTDGADRDNAVDLGNSSSKFKDLYLGGGLYVGGTGSANYLDDYEEGTWTPAFVGATNSPGLHNNVGRYTRIGRLVVVQFFQQTSGSPAPVFSNNSAAFQISGVPFSVQGHGYTGSQGSMNAQAFHYNGNKNTQSTQADFCSPNITGSDLLEFQVTASGSTRGVVNNNGAREAPYVVEVTISYFTDA